MSVIYCAVSRSALNIKFLFWSNLEFPPPGLSSSQCLYWNVSLISVRKTGKKFQSGSFLQEMLSSLNTLISDSFHCVLVY